MGREDSDGMTREDELSKVIIGAATEVHSALGPGLLESVYEACPARELVDRRVPFERQVPIPVNYKGEPLDCGFRADLIVEGLALVELKAVDRLAPIHAAQAMTYLRLSPKRLCLPINFNTVHLRDGIKRVVMGLPEGEVR
jgi:GxxExxY protein